MSRPARSPAFSPLQQFIRKIASISGSAEAGRCIGVLEQVGAFHQRHARRLEQLHQDFVNTMLDGIGWTDVARWIAGWASSYGAQLRGLAAAANEARRLDLHVNVVTRWTDRLRGVLTDNVGSETFTGRTILCALSAAVDATYKLESKPSLQNLISSLSRTADVPLEEFVARSYREFDRNRSDRKTVNTPEEVLAEIFFALQNPGANLKPALVQGSPAEKWARQFYFDRKLNKSLSGGGASVNIADALAGLGIEAHGFWALHPGLLAGTSLRCAGKTTDRVKRCWFDRNWNWKQGRFSEAGGGADGTGQPHPVRMSIVFTFTRNTPEIGSLNSDIGSALPESIESAGTGRVIFQFVTYSPEYFEDERTQPASWSAPPNFGRWEQRCPPLVSATKRAMTAVKRTGYHRVIVSAFQRAPAGTLSSLSAQCDGIPIHHEISAAFDKREEVENYCNALDLVYGNASIRTAGMNDSELEAFTSWPSTKVFSALKPVNGSSSLLQRFFRAMKVRDAFNLNWLYIHGNDIDITVHGSGIDQGELEAFRNAMLAAKVGVFAALHVRSSIRRVLDRFEPVCSPKGFLALYQFASEFARQYARTDKERDDIQGRIIADGFIAASAEVPSVIAVPVYWPDPESGCSLAGGGDISSGIVAALAR